MAQATGDQVRGEIEEVLVKGGVAAKRILLRSLAWSLRLSAMLPQGSVAYVDESGQLLEAVWVLKAIGAQAFEESL